MADFSSMLHVAGLPNLLSGDYEGTRVEWTNTTTWGSLPSILKRVRTHGTVTVGIPYIFGPTASYPCGLTAAAATNFKTNIIVFKETHSSAGYYEGVVAGYFADAVTNGSVTSGNGLEVINSGVAFIPDGSTPPVQTINCCAVALETDTGTSGDIWLLGIPVDLAAS